MDREECAHGTLVASYRAPSGHEHENPEQAICRGSRRHARPLGYYGACPTRPATTGNNRAFRGGDCGPVGVPVGVGFAGAFRGNRRHTTRQLPSKFWLCSAALENDSRRGERVVRRDEICLDAAVLPSSDNFLVEFVVFQDAVSLDDLLMRRFQRYQAIKPRVPGVNTSSQQPTLRLPTASAVLRKPFSTRSFEQSLAFLSEGAELMVTYVIDREFADLKAAAGEN